jgi:predicted RNA-binding protein with PUA-like domain
MNYWLIKSPFKNRGWQEAVMSGKFSLFGIRSHIAKKNISEMEIGDKALYYHKKQVWGVMEVIKEPYPDPTSSENWLSVDFQPIKTSENPITLEQVKQNDILKNTAIIKQPRLSVVKLSEEEFKKLIDIICP